MIEIKRPLAVVVCAFFGSLALADGAPSPFVHAVWATPDFALTPLSGSSPAADDTISQPSYRVETKNRVVEYSTKTLAFKKGQLVLQGLKLKVKLGEVRTTAVTIINIPQVTVRNFKVETSNREEKKEIALPTLTDPSIEFNEIETLAIALPPRVDFISSTKDGKTDWRITNLNEVEASLHASLDRALTPEMLKAATRPKLEVPEPLKGTAEQAVTAVQNSLVPSIRTALIQWAASNTLNEKLVLSAAKALPFETLPEGELSWSVQQEKSGGLSLVLSTGTEIPQVTDIVTALPSGILVVANETGVGLIAHLSARIAEAESKSAIALRVDRDSEPKVKFDSQKGQRLLSISADLALAGESTRAVQVTFKPTGEGRLELQALVATPKNAGQTQLFSQMLANARGGLETAALRTLVSSELAKSQTGEQRVWVRFTDGKIPGSDAKTPLFVVQYR